MGMSGAVKQSSESQRTELVRGAVWSVLGLVTPLLFALYAIPRLIAGFGLDRFGLLTILWMLVGYFSLFDMGFGRALTQLVSQRIGAGLHAEVRSLVWSGLWLMGVMGTLGCLVLLLASSAIVAEVLTVPTGLQVEGVDALQLLAFGMPLVIVSAGLVGVLEAHHRFGVVSAIRVPAGVLNFGAPLLGLLISDSLVVASGSLLVVRVASSVAYAAAAARVEPGLRAPQWPRQRDVRDLSTFGGWLTVSNVVGPFMVYFDRIVIGALTSLREVAFYTTPYEVLSRTQVVPVAMMNVLFPAATRALAHEPSRLMPLASMSFRGVIVLILPLTCGIFLAAPELLNAWLGADFAARSSAVVRWLALGYLVNALARLPLAILQAGGRPDFVAKAHLAELLPYALLLWALTLQYGIAGAAAAWFFRASADFVLLSELAARRFAPFRSLAHSSYLLVAGVVGGLGVAMLIDGAAYVRFGAMVILVAACARAGLPLVRELRIAFGRARPHSGVEKHGD